MHFVKMLALPFCLPKIDFLLYDSVLVDSIQDEVP